jgi:hypothetical protein
MMIKLLTNAMSKKKNTPATTDLSKLVTVTEASKQSGYADAHIRLLARRGSIQARKVGPRAWLVSLESLRAYAQSDRARAH